MEVKNALLGAALLYGVYSIGHSAGYGKCMVDVMNQYSDCLPDGKLTLKHPKKENYSITVSKPEKKES